MDFWWATAVAEGFLASPPAQDCNSSIALEYRILAYQLDAVRAVCKRTYHLTWELFLQHLLWEQARAIVLRREATPAWFRPGRGPDSNSDSADGTGHHNDWDWIHGYADDSSGGS